MQTDNMSECSELAERRFRLECANIEFERRGAEPLSFAGPGHISQSASGPASIRVKADMYVKPCQTTLAELQRQESVLREQAKPQSAAEVSQLETNASQLSGRYWSESKPFTDETRKVLDLFQAEYLSATRHLRTFTYLSYVLYPLGIIIGILGQLAGVKPPGGE